MADTVFINCLCLYSSEKNMYIATNEVEYDENYKVINTKTKLMKFELNNGKIIVKN